MWTAARTKDSCTMKFATTNHALPSTLNIQSTLKTALLKPSEERGGLETGASCLHCPVSAPEWTCLERSSSKGSLGEQDAHLPKSFAPCPKVQPHQLQCGQAEKAERASGKGELLVPPVPNYSPTLLHSFQVMVRWVCCHIQT